MLRSLVGSEMCIRDRHWELGSQQLHPRFSLSVTPLRGSGQAQPDQVWGGQNAAAASERAGFVAMSGRGEGCHHEAAQRSALEPEVIRALFVPVSYTHLTLPTKRIV
eukprot:TRINITY_DN48028_c0_g1_i1.p1 TRINITY_DN48028_c0_g1~~TRINITY_DN48028_c0_g1_i1.p1  ORF type:complete len:107 (-),score=25.29 TRINITY_DN48028_c0_g1_i1:56-376(-)